jgi:glucosylceramidase
MPSRDSFSPLRLVLVSLLIGGLVMAAQSVNPPVKVWLTTANEEHLLEPQAPLGLAPIKSSKLPTIYVDGGRAYQQMEGFGASLTESSAYLLNRKLTPEAREQTLHDLFDPESGIGLSYLRQPMGASDFALSSYSYDDLPPNETDPKLEHFNIDRDRQDILPVLKRILEINPQLQIMATPWSPPAWMKTSGSMLRGSLRPEFRETLAQYFVKFIQAYALEGVTINTIMVNNEPHYASETYPGMLMEANEQARFIAQNLGPALRDAKLETKILIWDHNWDQPQYPLEVLKDPEARTFIAGTAWHCYAGDVAAQSAVHEAYTDKDTYFTECSSGRFAPGFANQLFADTKNLLIGATRNWAKTVIKWNLALDDLYGPQNGGCPNCQGTIEINQKTGKVTRNTEYYALGQVSKFVRRGAYRIASSEDVNGLKTVAFKNRDGTKVLLVLNTDYEAASFRVVDKNRAFESKLAARSVVSFVYRY